MKSARLFSYTYIRYSNIKFQGMIFIINGENRIAKIVFFLTVILRLQLFLLFFSIDLKTDIDKMKI